MATTNQHKLIFVKQTNEPIREKEHVDISDTAKFQMQVKWQTFEKSENKRQMYGSQAWVNLRSRSPFPSEKFVQRNLREKHVFAGGEGEGGLIAGQAWVDPLPDTFVSYFRVFQMSVMLQLFGQQL